MWCKKADWEFKESFAKEGKVKAWKEKQSKIGCLQTRPVYPQTQISQAFYKKNCAI